MCKIYLVQDAHDTCVEAIYFNKNLAERKAIQLGRCYVTWEFETEDDPVAESLPFDVPNV